MTPRANPPPKAAVTLADPPAVVELFHTNVGTAYADLIIEGHRETWPIRSTRFRTWLRRRYYTATGVALSAAAVASALDQMEAQAQFDGPERAVHVRIAEQDDHIYLDLADECWRAVEIGASGWRLISAPPVRFIRTPGMLPLPVPERGGSVEALAGLLNLPGRDEFVLLIAWLLATLRSGGPYPLLAVAGEQGSAKTFLTKVLRALIDPNIAPVRAAPREERELFVSARNSHMLAFDNLSHMPPWISDALCRLASGGSFAVRRLYTDEDEVLFSAARPVVLNGIEEVITRPDLADRAIFLTLDPISEQQRRPEQDLWREFELKRPSILGAMLDIATHGLRTFSDVQVKRWPRMADFAQWGCACEGAFVTPGAFLRAYSENRSAVRDGVLDADPVAVRVREIMARCSTWSGSASDLMRAGAPLPGFPGSNASNGGWPTNPRALAGRLRRAQTFLRTQGIEIDFSREGRSGTRTIRIRSSPRYAGSSASSEGPRTEAASSGYDHLRDNDRHRG
jgi:hypothetical protein